nr:unnamed protein product [Spirometra erinaceieuropaei]
MVCTSRKQEQKRQKMRTYPDTTFVEPTKAFDTNTRDEDDLDNHLSNPHNQRGHSQRPSTTTVTTTDPTSSNVVSTPASPHSNHTVSRIGLVGHLRSYRTETSAPVPGTPAHAHRISLHRPHHLRTSSHPMDLLDHMRIRDSGIHSNINTPRTPDNSPIPSTINSSSNIAAATSGITSATNSAAPNLSCPHCRRTRTPSIGLTSHLESIAQRLASLYLEHQHNPPHPHQMPTLPKHIQSPHGSTRSSEHL